MPACTVCQHEDRAAIDAQLVSRSPVRSVARRFGLVETSLRRHLRHHVSRDLAQAAEGRELKRASSLLDRVEALGRETLGVLEMARAGTDARVVLAAVREQRANLELLGRLKGELVAGGFVAITMRFGVRDEAEMEALIKSGRRFQQIAADATAALDTCRDEAVELLRLILRERPEWRDGVLERLGFESLPRKHI